MAMEVNEYQILANRTLIDKPEQPLTDNQLMGAWCAVGLAGESGEVAELIKKGVFHGHGVDHEKLKKELGDVLWYVAGLCRIYSISMEEVMRANIKKLKIRYPNGFNCEDSINRDIKKEMV